MKLTQQAFFINADCEETQLVRIHAEPRMRTDMVRIGMGSADVRYRPEYIDWYAELNIEFNQGVFVFIMFLLEIIKALTSSVSVTPPPLLGLLKKLLPNVTDGIAQI